ncbi:hypothetical protein SteCoe_13420 [Stentor coeruleus]|uniref:Uncharacterized protein n=1 Tax=Stentor coeruleus TaxID=5963 RepID=A0A1R2C8J3_9CILI|nr:hypothetical protein SteCoe_13420 [Stentor coeruleus]
MQKPIFPSLRMPAYELPMTSPCTFPIKLSNTPIRPNQNPSSLPKTNTVSIKNSLNLLKDRPISSNTGCQVDFQEEFIKQLEKEMLSEPTMQFLEVKDVEMEEKPSQTPNGMDKFSNPHQDFMQVQEISVSTPFPIQNLRGNYTGSDKKLLTSSEKSEASGKEKVKKGIVVEDKEKEKYDQQAYDPIFEFKETQDFKMREAQERLERLEEEALKLENEMKMQNDQLDRLNLKFTEENFQDRRSLASKYIEKMTNPEPTMIDDEDRMAKILSTNQELYSRIEKALAPKPKISKESIQEFPEKQEILEASEVLESKKLAGRYTKINPIVSKRITEAMSTAATAIQVSKQLHPQVLKKPVRYNK